MRRILLLILPCLLMATAVPSFAQQKKAATTTTKAKTTTTKKLSRSDYEKQQKELQKQIAATEKMISDNNKSVLSQSRDIKLREDELTKRRALLDAMTKEVQAIQQEEDSLKRLIVRLTKDYKGKQEKYAEAVRHLYKWRSGYDEWLFVISAGDVVSSMRRIRYLRQYSQWREREGHELERQRLATESVRQRLALTRADRETLLTKMEGERQALARKQQVQEAALANLKKHTKELKKELAAAQKKQREIQNMIQKLVDAERKKTAGGTSTSKGSKDKSGGTIYSPSQIEKLTGSFKQNKGKMPYPVDSNYAILSHYTKDGNYSITLSTSTDAHACAIFEGVVMRAVRSSEDWTVIVSHGEYMSVYSNLSACHVKEGQEVKMRQSIGMVKADIDGRHAELMFWIYGKSDAENPEAWLQR